MMMSESQVNEEEQLLPNKLPEEAPTPRMRGWYLFGGVLLLLIMGVLLLFGWRLTERTALMETDLRAFIRYEEQQRAFGLTEEADELMVSNAPKVWQEAYRRSFTKFADLHLKPNSLEVEEIELKGTDAYVTVRFDNGPQVRFYQLVSQKWRRGPLPESFWGEEQQLELADEGITIVYPARELPFVQRVAADLQTLLQQWPAKTTSSTGTSASLTPFTIKIKPSEFAPALLNVSEGDDTRQIVLNSPSLMMQGQADGEGGIRLALADALLEEVDLDYQRQMSLLPGSVTFLGGIRNIFISRWALSDEAIPRQIWHDKVADFWESPFLSEAGIYQKEIPLKRIWNPHSSEATVLLMADYLYDQYGSEGLGQIIKQLPTAQSWDRIFYPLTGHYTIELENKVHSANNNSKKVGPNVPQLPFSATLLGTNPDSDWLQVEVIGEGRQLSIQMADSTLIDAEEANPSAHFASTRRWNSHCAMLHKEVTIKEGDWLTVGEVLKARQMVISEPEPVILSETMTLAPSDTIAYLAEGGNNPERIIGTFVALSEDGQTTDLITLPPLMVAGRHMQGQTPWPARFFLILGAYDCGQTWLFMYDPEQGIVGHWLTSSSNSSSNSFFDRPLFPHFMWRPQEGDFILKGAYGKEVDSSENEPYLSAKPGEALRLLEKAENVSHILGWLGEKQVVFDKEQGVVKLIHLTSGEVTTQIPLASENIRTLMLSEDGQHLFYTYGLPRAKQSVHVVSLESGQDRFLLSASENEQLRPFSGGADYLLLAVADEKYGDLPLTALWLLDLNASSQATIIMEIPFTEHITSVFACADNRVLMTTYEQGETEVQMWQPDGNTKSLLRTDKELTLLSCR